MDRHRRPQWQSPQSSPPHISAHTSQVSWPLRKLQRKPQWQGPRGVYLAMSAHPSHACGPVGSSTDSPSGRVRMASLHSLRRTPNALRGQIKETHRRPHQQGPGGPPAHFGAPLACFAAPWGARPKTSLARPARRPHADVGAPPTCSVASERIPPTAPRAMIARRPRDHAGTFFGRFVAP